ncbi:hypothetical protein E2562_015876 [Oryza meyeriana var. granulata]|uniref:Uncharacterized protein n=1 Tax=Oryza meyeriana var. granulata TaxID=110450 RepID=A0A6G1D5G2_9ORYZ|nr:hypothetical protein E2562_015876 [Oryza meyeriana var. granulata]
MYAQEEWEGGDGGPQLKSLLYGGPKIFLLSPISHGLTRPRAAVFCPPSPPQSEPPAPPDPPLRGHPLPLRPRCAALPRVPSHRSPRRWAPPPRLLLAVYHPRNRYVLHLSADASDAERRDLAA